MLILCPMFLICKLSEADAVIALTPSAAPYIPKTASLPDDVLEYDNMTVPRINASEAILN